MRKPSLTKKIAGSFKDFWCLPEDGSWLAVMRVLCGVIFTYSLLVHTFDLEEFFSPQGWFPAELMSLSPRAPYNQLTWLSAIHNLSTLRLAHVLAVSCVVLFTLGLALRVTAPLTALIALAYVNRNEMILFGFDQTLTPFLLYLALHRRGLTTGNRLARRLIQLHLCIIYASAGFMKLHPSWFDGAAIWRTLATVETARSEFIWITSTLAHSPWLLTMIGIAIVIWECTHPLLLWIRPLRPLAILMAIAVHGGIAIFLRLGVFSWVMIAAHASFIEPFFWQRLMFALKTFTLRPKTGTIEVTPPKPRPSITLE